MVSNRRNGIYRGIILAFGLILVAAGPPNGENASSIERQAQGQISDALKGIDASIQKAAKPDITNKPCTDGKDHRDSDLCAQWKAADAAASAALAAWVIGGFGLLVAGATLVAAIQAARWAKGAVEETKRSANIAWDIGLAQTSPLLDFTEAAGFQKLNFGEFGQVNVSLKNAGETVALNVKLFGIIVWGGAAISMSTARLRDATKSLSAIGKGQEGGFVLSISNPANVFEKFDAGSIWPGRAIIGVQYEDDFGNAWVQRVRLNLRFRGSGQPGQNHIIFDCEFVRFRQHRKQITRAHCR